jgi:TPR repeat protein
VYQGLLFVRSRMPPSRQERRKAERDAAKRASARAGAAGAAGANQESTGAAAALANFNVNVTPPLGDWTTQAEDPNSLIQRVGAVNVKRRSDAGDREAQYSLGSGRCGGAAGHGGRSPQSDEGVARLEKAAGQGHVYAMYALGRIHHVRKEYEQAVSWCTKAAEAGLSDAMFSLGLECCLGKGEGVAAPDPLAAMDWFRRAADAGHGGVVQVESSLPIAA